MKLEMENDQFRKYINLFLNHMKERRWTILWLSGGLWSEVQASFLLFLWFFYYSSICLLHWRLLINISSKKKEERRQTVRKIQRHDYWLSYRIFSCNLLAKSLIPWCHLTARKIEKGFWIIFLFLGKSLTTYPSCPCSWWSSYFYFLHIKFMRKFYYACLGKGLGLER